MKFTGFKDYPDTSTPLNAEYMTAFLNALLPIGKIELFFDSDDHSNFLGFKWIRTSIGKFPIGIDLSDDNFNKIGNTGGEKEHILTINELPNHTHFLFNSNGGQTDIPAYSAKDNGVSGTTLIKGYASSTTPTGNGSPHNNLPPYEVVALWRRIE